MQDGFQDFKSWYLSKPPVARTYVTVAFILAAGVSLQLIQYGSLPYTFQLTFFEFNLWRPFTSLFFQGKFSFMFLFTMFFTYFAISRTETQLFNNQTFADFLWLCVYLFGSLLAIASLLPIYLIGDGFVFAMLYIWCKRRPFETIRLFFGLQVKSGYFPWVFMGFHILSGASLYIYLAGLFLGHLYIAIKDIYMPRYHRDYLPTPEFFKRLVYKNDRGVGVRRNVGQAFGGRGVRLE